MAKTSLSVEKAGPTEKAKPTKKKVIAERRAAVEADPRWRAVVDRDGAWDGIFMLGVGSTRIYCRPVCPARLPRAEVVTFFDEPASAEGAGFRACKRCKPKEAPPHLSEVERVRRVCRLLQAQPGERRTSRRLAEVAGLHPRTLQRVFQKHVGLTPSEYAEACRASHFKGLIREGASVTEATYEAGYGSSSRVYEGAGRRLGMTPGQYAKGGEGLAIRYGTSACELGGVLVGATEVGVCAVYVGDERESLVRELETEFPRSTIEADDAGLSPWVALLARHLAGQAAAIELPLDVRATAFQRQVWQALREIPLGETRTYSQIAESLGAPKAARAVGNACARNPVSIVVPCHRAVREDGGLGGYRWGLDRKRALLQRESGG